MCQWIDPLDSLTQLAGRPGVGTFPPDGANLIYGADMLLLASDRNLAVEF